MTVKNMGNYWLAYAKYRGNPCLCEGNSFIEAFNGCLELINNQIGE